MRPNTITPTDCGNCKHWHEWPVEKYTKTYTDWKPKLLHIGDCDKIPKGTKLKPTEDGTVFDFDGCAFEDENYNEEWGCFEPPKEE